MEPVISGLLGVLIGGAISYVSGVRFIKLNQKLCAGQKLRSELVIIISNIFSVNDGAYSSQDDIIINKLLDHESLAIEYKHYLPSKELNAFNKT